MQKLLDLRIPEQGLSLQQLINDCATTLKYQVKTGKLIIIRFVELNLLSYPHDVYFSIMCGQSVRYTGCMHACLFTIRLLLLTVYLKSAHPHPLPEEGWLMSPRTICDAFIVEIEFKMCGDVVAVDVLIKSESV